MTLTENALAQAVGCSPPRAASWLPHIVNAMGCFDIDTARRQAAFLAQVGHESGGLLIVTENLNYSASGLTALFAKHFAPGEAEAFARQPEKIANRIYSSRMGNGDEASGDGWRFRGRGLIQLTGRDNYKDCGNGISADLLVNPDMLAQPETAAMSAAWYWWAHGLSHFADSEDFTKITQVINGGQTGADDRLKLWAAAKLALRVTNG